MLHFTCLIHYYMREGGREGKWGFSGHALRHPGAQFVFPCVTLKSLAVAPQMVGLRKCTIIVSYLTSQGLKLQPIQSDLWLNFFPLLLKQLKKICNLFLPLLFQNKRVTNCKFAATNFLSIWRYLNCSVI